MKTYPWFALALLASGCTTSSGVLTLGPDTYSVSAGAAPASGGAPWAERMALTDANQHCASMGREVLVTNISSGAKNVYGADDVQVTFRCLAKGDPELIRR